MAEDEEDSLIEAVRRLAEMAAAHGLSELTVEDGGVTITVKALPEAAPATAAMPLMSLMGVQAHPHALPPVQTPPYSQTMVTEASPAKPARTGIALESPMVGVFYRSPSPEDPPFVVVGDLVRVGQTIGLIEAMKVYSEVPSEVAGRVVETPVESGKLVQQGQALIVVEPQ